MAQKLQKKIKNIDIEVSSAQNLLTMLEKRSIKNADLIISGIPWASLKIKRSRLVIKIHSQCFRRSKL